MFTPCGSGKIGPTAVFILASQGDGRANALVGHLLWIPVSAFWGIPVTEDPSILGTPAFRKDPDRSAGADYSGSCLFDRPGPIDHQNSNCLFVHFPDRNYV